jgi:phospholipase C
VRIRSPVPRHLGFYGYAARDWTVCDRYFAAMMAPTYPNRFFLHAAQTDRTTTSLDKIAQMPRTSTHSPTSGSASTSSARCTTPWCPARTGRTVFVIMYDEWGGFFDHVVPPVGPDPNPDVSAGLRGFRVPCLVVSPRAG